MNIPISNPINKLPPLPLRSAWPILASYNNSCKSLFVISNSMSKPNPTLITTHPILTLLKKCRSLKILKQIHCQMITTGLILHTYPLSQLLLLSSAIDSTYSLSIFNQARNPTIFLYNTLISSLCNNNNNNHKNNPFDQIHTSFSLYRTLIYHTDPLLKPNSYTYPSLFKACGGSPQWLLYGRVLHAHLLKFLGHCYDHFVQASLVNYYSRCGKLGASRYLFDQIENPDLALWNTILSAYSRMGNGNVNLGFLDGFGSSGDGNSSMEPLVLFSEMQGSSVSPNEVTLVALISACADLGALAQGTWAHAYALKNKLVLNRFVITALIDMYAKCGCLAPARQLFDEFPHRDTLCYNAMIRGLAVHGYGHCALELFEQLKTEGLRPDEVTLIVTMNACSHAGLVTVGCRIFDTMEEDYAIEPKLEHFCCLVDLLGRAGRLEEAMERIEAMPMSPNAVIWRSLLSASRVHGNVKIGELALNHLVELEPETSGNYVLLSNMYAKSGQWDEANKVRRLMKERDIDKAPGSSLVEIDGAIHEFLMGDRTHPDSKEIYMKLEEMNMRLQNHGHMVRTEEVLFDIEEEERQGALSVHSERLAIAYALIATRADVPIRIIKNLRVCNDCHEITKLVSRIYGREIVVRDGNRFHHFRNGTCSCLDYW